MIIYRQWLIIVLHIVAQTEQQRIQMYHFIIFLSSTKNCVSGGLVQYVERTSDGQVCSAHFILSDYSNQGCEKTKLKDIAVPSTFNPPHLTKSKNKRYSPKIRAIYTSVDTIEKEIEVIAAKRLKSDTQQEVFPRKKKISVEDQNSKRKPKTKGIKNNIPGIPDRQIREGKSTCLFM